MKNLPKQPHGPDRRRGPPQRARRLEAEAEHHRARLALYRERSYGGKADNSRLRELQRASKQLTPG